MSKAENAPAGRRFARRDWIELGLARLREAGPDALTIERLTAAAEKTRGSFYHHFPSHENFIATLADTWLRTSTTNPIAEMQQTGEVRQIRRSLSEFAANLDHRLERQMRRLAESDSKVRAVVRKSDEARMAFLVELFERGFGLPPEEALKRAQIQHALFVGVQFVFPDSSSAFKQELDRYLAGMLWQ